MTQNEKHKYVHLISNELNLMTQKHKWEKPDKSVLQIS